ncbi:hypothetical protein [Xanthomarina gelatinilytica]|uniref:DUF3108 domain-containing protein n=1 Tax=Xanthomarina gelatinilytica TaxID=1137281 RepID=UPI003AA813BD
MRKLVLIIVVLFCCINSNAQDTINVSFKNLNTKKITPSTRNYVQYVEHADGHISFNTLLNKKIEKVNFNNKKAFLIVQKYQSEQIGINIDSSYIDASTMAPIVYNTDIATLGYKEKVVFGDKEIINKTVYKDSIKTSTAINKDFFNVVVVDEIISALPLENDKVFLLKCVNPGLNFFEDDIVVTVLGKETLNINNNDIKCWKLKVYNTLSKSSTINWYAEDGLYQMKMLFNNNGISFIRALLYI